MQITTISMIAISDLRGMTIDPVPVDEEVISIIIHGVDTRLPEEEARTGVVEEATRQAEEVAGEIEVDEVDREADIDTNDI